MYYELCVTQPIHALTSLKAILEKGQAYADAKKFETSVLLNSRLAPDMLPLSRQIHIATDTIKLGAARLTNKDAPTHDDKEQTWGEFLARIDSVIAYLKTLKEADFQGAHERKITTPRWEGKWLTGAEYMSMHMLPNMYFHITTAYAILRHNGVEIGKKDYLGELPYKK